MVLLPLLLALAAPPPARPPASDLTSLTFSAPVTVVTLDGHKLDGAIVEMAWSPDGTKLYLQTVTSDRDGNQQSNHYLLALSAGKPERLDVEPDWASQYWGWKSSPVSPGSSDFKISVRSHQETLRSTTVSMGGALATGAIGGSGTTVDDVTTAIRGQQTATVVELGAAHVTIGSWMDEPVRPGFTFGWAPASIGLLTFADRHHDDRLIVLDAAGHTRQLKGTRHAVLPAWTDDGHRLAYLQRDGGTKYRLQIINVTAGQ
ncbi:MAG TPA: hypothetical protein VND92_08515 [Vicinamibacterales bacterium]|nr:hypothetical protein [Vicinamibacterales bacterium]